MLAGHLRIAKCKFETPEIYLYINDPCFNKWTYILIFNLKQCFVIFEQLSLFFYKATFLFYFSAPQVWNPRSLGYDLFAFTNRLGPNLINFNCLFRSPTPLTCQSQAPKQAPKSFIRLGPGLLANQIGLPVSRLFRLLSFKISNKFKDEISMTDRLYLDV